MQKKFGLILTVCFLLFGTALYSGGGEDFSPPANSSVKIVKFYGGVCRLKRNTKEHNRAIKNRRQFRRFVKTIPKREIGMGRMPKSKDPLLKKPKINFKKYMLIVVVNPDPVTYTGPYNVSIIKEGKGYKVNYSLGEKTEDIQWQRLMGEYSAFLVKKVKGKVKFSQKKSGK